MSTMASVCSASLPRALAITCCLFLSAADADDYLVTYTPSADGALEIECQCVAPTGGFERCTGLRILDPGKERHRWVQQVFGRKGKEIDLSDACRRKAEAVGMGDGLCCPADRNDVARLFAAKVLK